MANVNSAIAKISFDGSIASRERQKILDHDVPTHIVDNLASEQTETLIQLIAALEDVMSSSDEELHKAARSIIKNTIDQ